MSKRKFEGEAGTETKDDNAAGDGWTTVGSNKKKQRPGDAPGFPPTGYPAIEFAKGVRLASHIELRDLQELALCLIADGKRPKWVSIKNARKVNQVVVLMVPGLEKDMFSGSLPILSPIEELKNENKHLHFDRQDQYPTRLISSRLPEPLKPLSNIFPDLWITTNTVDMRNRLRTKVHSPMHNMLTARIPKKDEQKLQGNRRPVHQTNKNFDKKPTAITEYILTLAQQQEYGFVVHPAWYPSAEAKKAAHSKRKAARQSIEDGWVDTEVDSLERGEVCKDATEEGSLLRGRNVLVIDCEFVKGDNDENLLARISILNYEGTKVLDTLVKPDVHVKDYVTQFSGMTEEMLRDVQTTLGDIQRYLMGTITPNTILVGHSLDSDLKVLKITHPYLIDTAQLYPHQRGLPNKQSLKWLAQRYLNRQIQTSLNGHDSLEDTQACLDLVKQKCERGPGWGTSEMNAESIFKRIGRANRPDTSSTPRKGAVVDWGEPERSHGSQAHLTIGCASDDEVVRNIERAAQGLAVYKDGTTGHVDFIWGRLRELELSRGWWDGGRTDGSRATNDIELIRQAALQRLGIPHGEQLQGHGLGQAVCRTVDHIVKVYESLPPCTALIVYSGTGDPREIRRLQRQVPYANAIAIDEACDKARFGVGFITIK